LGRSLPVPRSLHGVTPEDGGAMWRTASELPACFREPRTSQELP
jgi:hypothetical protein